MGGVWQEDGSFKRSWQYYNTEDKIESDDYVEAGAGQIMMAGEVFDEEIDATEEMIESAACFQAAGPIMKLGEVVDKEVEATNHRL